MTDSRHKQLLEHGDALFSDKSSLNTLHQEIADNFYPERADFTRDRYLGTDFASDLMSSYPLIVRRELSNAISSILRPTNLDWFELTVGEIDKLDKAGKEWLEHATGVQRRAMYDRATQFVRATKEGDADFTTFGQAVITTDFDPREVALLYRTWHLRDAAWTETYRGDIGEVHLNWRPTIRDLVGWFGLESLHQSVQDAYTKEPNKRINCRRVVVAADEFETYKPSQHKWVLVYLDRENHHLVQEQPRPNRGITIPRWQTVSGSQYAFSPATVVGLPDARLIQSMTLTLLEAGEMAVRPPMLASGDYIREDLSNFAGGVTYVSGEYDKRKMDILRPLNQDTSRLPFGMDFAAEVRELLAGAFYLNKLTLPPAEPGMTAYETSERIKEYIRAAAPLFEPMQYEYNHGLNEATFDELMPRGAFGSFQDIPESLHGREIEFKFESPLHEATERQKGVTFLEAKEMILQAYEIDKTAVAVLDARTALRESLESIRTPENWLRPEEQVEELAEQAAEAQKIQQEASMAADAADAAGVVQETQ